MALRAGKNSLDRFVLLGLGWSCGMISRTVGQTTFSSDYKGVYIPLTGPPLTMTCPPSARYITSGGWAACCEHAQCWLPTTCNAGTARGPEGQIWTCPDDTPYCYTTTIFDQYPSPSQSWVEVGCGYAWGEYAIYRNVDAYTTSSPATSEPIVTSVVTIFTTGPSLLPPTATEDPKPSTSKAWIAGPVAGGVAALLLLGALFFWWRGKKNRQNNVEALGGYQPEYVGKPHASDNTSNLHSPSSPPAVPYYPPNSHPHYGTNPPGLHDASNMSQYTYPVSGTPNTRSWQGPPMPVSELDPAGMQYKHTIAEAP